MEAGIFTGMVASQYPLRIGRTQSPLKTSATLMFLLFCTYPQNQASLFRILTSALAALVCLFDSSVF